MSRLLSNENTACKHNKIGNKKLENPRDAKGGKILSSEECLTAALEAENYNHELKLEMENLRLSANYCFLIREVKKVVRWRVYEISNFRHAPKSAAHILQKGQ